MEAALPAGNVGRDDGGREWEGEAGGVVGEERRGKGGREGESRQLPARKACDTMMRGERVGSRGGRREESL